MNDKPVYSRTETEYNALWALKNPELFEESLLDAFGKYSGDYKLTLLLPTPSVAIFRYNLDEGMDKFKLSTSPGEFMFCRERAFIHFSDFYSDYFSGENAFMAKSYGYEPC